MVMRNLVKVGLALMVAGMMAMSACGSSNKPNTNVMNGTGGATGTGTGGSGTDAGTDVPGTGGSDGGSAGTGGAAANAHQDHLNIINAATAGGMTVTRPAPVAYDVCKI